MKVISIYSRNSLKRSLVYKWDIWISVLSGIFNILGMLFLWSVVYKNSGKSSIGGYNFNSIVLYTLMSNLTAMIINVDIARIISNEVKSGEITNSFIRPVSYITKLVGEGIGHILFNLIMLFSPIISILIIYMNIFNIKSEITLGSILFYTVSLLFSIIINFEISILVGFCSFYVNYIWGFILLENAILTIVTGQLFPLNFYPDKVVKFLEITPFYYINFGPVSILLNKFSKYNSIRILLIQSVWCIILAIFVSIIYNKAKTRLQINGG
ncbi:ABC transporter permease [Streptobacillus moniliformis]|uniref:ABC transporter permease n=1 Tax=Streptobacillus moniliformis TaxID=34105 RepID=UPI0009BDC6C4|nr:ABC-2 family transporter protein [Streptobacillus moniliformis]